MFAITYLLIIYSLFFHVLFFMFNFIFLFGLNSTNKFIKDICTANSLIMLSCCYLAGHRVICIAYYLMIHFRTDKEVGSMDEAHEGMVWSMAWHPLGHILVSGSNDHTTSVSMFVSPCSYYWTSFCTKPSLIMTGLPVFLFCTVQCSVAIINLAKTNLIQHTILFFKLLAS